MKLPLCFLGVVGAAVLASACKDPVHVTAQRPTLVDTVTVYALSGTSPSLPSGLDLFSRQAVVVDGFGAFDLAFDIVSSSQVRILPVRLVVTSPTGVRPVGIRKFTGTFDALLKAPTGAYPSDSAVVVSPGEVAVVESSRSFPGEFCQYAISPYLYAKISVLSIDLAARTIRFRIGFNPNCGFRSLEPGIPTS